MTHSELAPAALIPRMNGENISTQITKPGNKQLNKKNNVKFPRIYRFKGNSTRNPNILRENSIKYRL